MLPFYINGDMLFNFSRKYIAQKFMSIQVHNFFFLNLICCVKLKIHKKGITLNEDIRSYILK